MKPIMNIDDPRYVKALSHPLRVRILAMLQERTASPSQLSEWLGATLGTTAYHVRSLHQLGLIELSEACRTIDTCAEAALPAALETFVAARTRALAVLDELAAETRDGSQSPTAAA